MASANVNAVRELYEHWARGDWAAGAEKFADELVDCGDRVLSLGHQYATGRASGAELSMRMYDVFTFRDGEIVEFHISRDEGVARRLAGFNAR